MGAESGKLEDVIGLCLSGGGFRASLFHVGSLWRLAELGLLGKVARISSVSGGSITAGVLALAWNDLKARGFAPDAFASLVADRVRDFCARDLDAWAIGEGALLPWRTAGEVVTREYGDRLFGSATLHHLPETPVFVFNATNLQTGRVVRMTRKYIADWTVGEVPDPEVPLAAVVAASSAFPPFLSPIVIAPGKPFRPLSGSIHHGNRDFTDRLHLTDGGAYDNLGLEPVWKRCRTILVSDAGAPFGIGATVETDWVKQTLRALDVATDQSRGLRKRWLVDQYERKVRAGAYWGIDTDIKSYPSIAAMPCDPALANPLAGLRTRLNRFSDKEQAELINWGYALCDAAVRSRAEHLAPQAERPQAWPLPQHPLGRL